MVFGGALAVRSKCQKARRSCEVVRPHYREIYSESFDLSDHLDTLSVGFETNFGRMIQNHIQKRIFVSLNFWKPNLQQLSDSDESRVNHFSI